MLALAFCSFRKRPRNKMKYLLLGNSNAARAQDLFLTKDHVLKKERKFTRCTSAMAFKLQVRFLRLLASLVCQSLLSARVSCLPESLVFSHLLSARISCLPESLVYQNLPESLRISCLPESLRIPCLLASLVFSHPLSSRIPCLL